MYFPKLRFKGFNDDWSNSQLKDLFSVFNGYAFKSSDSTESGCRWIKIADVGIGVIKDDSPSYLPSSFIEHYSKFILKENDIILALTRPILNKRLKIAKIGRVHSESLLNQRVGKIITKNHPDFVVQRLKCYDLISKIEARIAGTDPPNLSPSEINSIRVKIPTLLEQQKIASFLSAVDKRIELLKKKKDLLEDYKKGVMQQLFSQQLRFKDENGNDFPEWEERKLKEVLFEHKTRSSGKEKVFSVSVHKGLINQIEHLGRSFAAKNTDHYNLVKNGDIVYTKSPTGDFPYGIIKQSHVDESVIVSPLYGVFTPETYSLGYILHVFFESKINVHNYLHSIIQKGAKNTINITNKTFLSKKMKLPIDKKEQQKIASFLSAIDSKIETTTQQIEGMQTFKKGLLQQMFV